MDDEFGDDIDWSAVPNVGGSSAAATMSTNNNNYNSMTNRGGALHQQMGATTNANVYNNTNTYNTNSAYPQQNIGNMGFDYAENSQPSLTTNNNNFSSAQPAPTNNINTNNYSSTDTNVLQRQASKLVFLLNYCFIQYS